MGFRHRGGDGAVGVGGVGSGELSGSRRSAGIVNEKRDDIAVLNGGAGDGRAPARGFHGEAAVDAEAPAAVAGAGAGFTVHIGEIGGVRINKNIFTFPEIDVATGIVNCQHGIEDFLGAAGFCVQRHGNFRIRDVHAFYGNSDIDGVGGGVGAILDIRRGVFRGKGAEAEAEYHDQGKGQDHKWFCFE